jgi:hypothetical protein
MTAAKLPPRRGRLSLMRELTNERRMFRIGVVICALAVMMAGLELGGGGLSLAEHAIWWPIVALMAATGVGLLFAVWPARIGGALLTALLAVVCVIGLVQLVGEIAGTTELALAELLPAANPAVTILFFLWLQVSGFLVLIGRPLGRGQVTARVAAGALAVIAACHLDLARELSSLPEAMAGTWTFSATVSGIWFLGFPGWPIWHAALLVVACALLVGRGRLHRHAATALLVLVAILCPLVFFALVQAEVPAPVVVGLVAVAAGTMAVMVYLAWWLRDELRSPRPDAA